MTPRDLPCRGASSRRRPGRLPWPLLAVALLCCCAGPQPLPAQEAAPQEAAAKEAAPEAPASQKIVVEELEVEVLATYPHDPQAFTQGLVFAGGELLESTGHFGRSELRRVDLRTGEVHKRVPLDADHFGEGLALLPADGGEGGDRLVQLTWLAGRALVWTADDFAPREGFRYDGEGWGLCFDGSRFVMSDGSAELSFRDPRSFDEVRRVTVTWDGHPVRSLNELECVGGEVWANVLGASVLVRIEPGSGGVSAVADASGLLTPEEAAAADVLNGIAWNPDAQVFYITGKNWPKLFEVRLVPRSRG